MITVNKVEIQPLSMYHEESRHLWSTQGLLKRYACIPCDEPLTEIATIVLSNSTVTLG